MARTSLSRKTALTSPDYYHIFYYVWWGNVATDGAYRHWNHHDYNPANNDIDSDYFPQQGAYSSNDPAVLAQHMQWIKRAGIGVVVIAWWGQGSYEDLTVQKVLAAANAQGLKVAFLIDDYAARTVNSIVSDIAYIYTRYGSHPAFYKFSRATKWGTSTLPRGVFYVYNSLAFADASWISALDALRGTSNDGIFLAQTTDASKIDSGHWDGAFPYDAYSNDGSLWASVGGAINAINSIWSAGVGPGFYDIRDAEGLTRSRLSGAAYDSMFNYAHASLPTFISITSFNEWHEGSMIEPAQAKQVDGGGYTYLDFNGSFGGLQGSDAQFSYIDRTKYWTASERRPQVYGSRPLTVRTPLTTKRTSYTAPWSGLGINVNHSGAGSSFPANFYFLRAVGYTKVRLLVVDYTLPTTLAEWRGYVQQALDAKFDEVLYGVSAFPGGSPLTATNYITYSQAILAEAAHAAAFNNPRLIYQIGNEEEEHVDGTTLTDVQLQSNLISLSNTIRGLYPRLKLSYSANQNHVYSWLNLANIGSLDKIGGNLYDTATNFDFFIQTLYKPLPNFSKFFITEWNSNGGYNDFNNEVTYAADIASRLQSIKNSGISTAYIYSFIDPNNAFGILSTDGVTYREAWQTLLASG